MKFVIFMGFVSLFADMSYEGARSISGAYLATLGVSAILIGILIGLGEFLGFFLRIFSGYFADKSRMYWPLTFIGYFLVFSIPLIYFSNSWRIVILLLILERVGKAIRTPARDAIISFATSKIGIGRGFGIHEALDQIGAMIGPLIVFLSLYFGFEYKESFGFLFLPTIFMTFLLFLARREYKTEITLPRDTKIGKISFKYMFFTIFSLAGFVNFQLIAYHFESNAIFNKEMIPLLYALAMGTDAISAFISGKFYDKFSLKFLSVIPLLTPISIFFTFSLNPIAGILLFGAILGMHESIMRAGVAEVSSADKRATAYGIFNTANGIGFLVGGVAFGFLYNNLQLMLLFSILSETIALVSLLFIIKGRVYS